jgi:hypothetical protein
MLAADVSFAIRAAGERDVAGMAALRAQTWGTEPYWTVRIGGYLKGEHSPQQSLQERVAFVAHDGAGWLVSSRAIARSALVATANWSGST